MRWASLGLFLILPLLGCSDPPSTEGVGQVLPPPPPRDREVDPLYDENGVPRESDIVVAGLTLPRGLTEIEGLQQDRRHIYASVVPRAPLLRYFGPRLTTLDIRHEGNRVTYAEARPRAARGGIVLLDVTIRPSSTRGEEVRVEVFERPPPVPEGTQVSVEEVRRRLESLRNEQRE